MQMMRANNNEANTKYETLAEKQNIWEEELRAKTERVNCICEDINSNILNDRILYFLDPEFGSYVKRNKTKREQAH